MIMLARALVPCCCGIGGRRRRSRAAPADRSPTRCATAATPATSVISAERDVAASRPDEAVWILTCSDGRYRVRFRATPRPQVEPLD